MKQFYDCLMFRIPEAGSSTLVTS